MTNFLIIITQSCVLILAMLFIRRIFMGKISPIMQYALWAIVGLRLFVPINIESTLSIFNLAYIGKAADTTANVVHETVVGTDFAGASISDLARTSTDAAHSVQTVSNTANGAITAQIFETVLFIIWIVGMVAVLIYALAANIRFYTHIRKNGRKENDCIVCEEIASPCLVGMFRPQIVLTQDAANDETARRYCILHEKTHIAHRDNIWTLFRLLACVIYWFNPLVWVAANVCRRDQELACDYSVIQKIGEENSVAYGKTLISLIRKDKPLPTLSTAMAADKKDMIQRIRLLAKRPKMLKVTAIALVLVVTLVSVAACTSAVTDKAIKSLFDNKVKYIGNNSQVSALLNTMDFPGQLNDRRNGIELGTQSEPYSLCVKFEVNTQEYSQYEDAYESEFSSNALTLFALIENMDLLEFEISDGNKAVTLQFSRGWADYMCGGNVASFGESAVSLEKLKAVQPYYCPNGCFIVSRMGNGVETEVITYPMSKENNDFCFNAVMGSLAKSAAWDGVDVCTLESCIRLRWINSFMNEESYYIYTLDGQSVFQFGEDGRYVILQPETYEKIVALIDANGAEGDSVTIIGGADGPTEIYFG